MEIITFDYFFYPSVDKQGSASHNHQDLQQSQHHYLRERGEEEEGKNGKAWRVLRKQRKGINKVMFIDNTG